MESYELKEYITGLYALAGWLEAHADSKLVARMSSYDATKISLWGENKEDFATIVRELGACEKSGEYSYLEAKKLFGPHYIEVNVSKSETCEQKVVGQKVEKVIEDRQAYNAAMEALRAQFTVEKLVDETEWICPDSFLGLAKES